MIQIQELLSSFMMEWISDVEILIPNSAANQSLGVFNLIGFFGMLV